MLGWLWNLANILKTITCFICDNKHFFQPVLKKANFQWTYTSWRRCHKCHLMTNFSGNSEYVNGFSKFLCEHGKSDSDFQVAKITIFSLFLFQCLLTLLQISCREKPYSSYYTERMLEDNIFILNLGLLRKCCGTGFCTSKFTITLPLLESIMYNYLGICGESFIQFGWDFRSLLNKRIQSVSLKRYNETSK